MKIPTKGELKSAFNDCLSLSNHTWVNNVASAYAVVAIGICMLASAPDRAAACAAILAFNLMAPAWAALLTNKAAAAVPAAPAA